MLDKRMNDKGKNWRHVLKSLKVLDYCLHEGSELVVTWARKNVYIIKTLREFQYVDDDGKDVGQNGSCSIQNASVQANAAQCVRRLKSSHPLSSTRSACEQSDLTERRGNRGSQALKNSGPKGVSVPIRQHLQNADPNDVSKPLMRRMPSTG